MSPTANFRKTIPFDPHIVVFYLIHFFSLRYSNRWQLSYNILVKNIFLTLFSSIDYNIKFIEQFNRKLSFSRWQLFQKIVFLRLFSFIPKLNFLSYKFFNLKLIDKEKPLKFFYYRPSEFYT